ncbi:MAG: putative zinc-binding protein [Hadesarchaea archaeon]|nr:putative zinc-binding protein [Hadesarchaea archaeon]
MKKIGLLPCSGACNVGTLSNKAVINTLEDKNDTDFVCALGLPLGIEGIIKRGKESDDYIAVNGCKVKCASKALSSADIDFDKEVIITENFEMDKSGNLKSEENLNRIETHLKSLVDELRE